MDFHLVQALHETIDLALRHPDDPSWAELRDQVERVLDRIGESSGDPTTEAIGIDRIDRSVIDPEQAERAVAALMAVHDREDHEQLELAHEAIQDLEDALG